MTAAIPAWRDLDPLRTSDRTMERRSLLPSCAFGPLAGVLAILVALAPRPAPAADDLLALPGSGRRSSTPSFELENFSEYALGAFPGMWKVRGRVRDAETVYRVAEEDGRRFLAAHSDGNSVMIGLEHAFNPAEYPYLRWDWRVRQLPMGADERVKSTNDSAAGVYVIFPGQFFLPRVLKYVWSSGAPVGLRKPSPAASSTKIIVLESGSNGSPEWRTVTVNVRQDYEASFGASPPQARGIGILTDANDTSSVAAADYANFELLRVTTDPVAPAVSKADAGGASSDSN